MFEPLKSMMSDWNGTSTPSGSFCRDSLVDLRLKSLSSNDIGCETYSAGEEETKNPSLFPAHREIITTTNQKVSPYVKLLPRNDYAPHRQGINWAQFDVAMETWKCQYQHYSYKCDVDHRSVSSSYDDSLGIFPFSISQQAPAKIR